MLLWIRNRTNTELIELCRAGVDDAWAELVRRFHGLVNSVPSRYGLDRDECADVVQHAFLQLYRNLGSIETEHGLPKWLTVVATRESLRRIRQGKRSVRMDDADLAEVASPEDEEQEAEAGIAVYYIRHALDKLGDRCKILLQMLYVEQLAYSEIVERLGMKIGAIGPTRQRCLEKIRKSMEAVHKQQSS